MDARLFALVSAENPKLIFAWGMQISHRDTTEAVIYRHDPRSGHTTTALHTCAEAALARWGRLGPLELRWEDDDVMSWTIAGTLQVERAVDRPDLLGEPVVKALETVPERELIGVAPIDPDLADTAAFCAEYGSPLDASANCVVVAGKRSGDERFAACLVLATTRADVNGIVRRRLDVRKASFAPTDRAVELTGMAYGGITPIGLPEGWPLLIDSVVAELPELVIGSGIRGSKLLIPGPVLAALPNAEVIEGLGQ